MLYSHVSTFSEMAKASPTKHPLSMCNHDLYASAFFCLSLQMMGPAAAAAHAQQLNEDNRQALVLFGIVIIFLACNIPRVVLNFHEVSLQRANLGLFLY